MNLSKYFRQELETFVPYTPGEQPATDAKVIKLNTNENPYSPSPKIKEEIDRIVAGGLLRKYPNYYSYDLQKEIADFYNLSTENLLVTNGSDEALRLLFFAILGQGDTLITPYPTYSHYPVLANMTMTGAKIKLVEVKDNLKFDFGAMAKEKGKLLAFAHPNAPTGILEKKEDIINLANSFDGILLSDEAYIDFAGESHSLLDHTGKIKNLVVCRTFSKSYSLAGLRVGFIAADKDIIQILNKLKDSYNVGMLEQYIALAAFKDREYFDCNIKKIISSRDGLSQKLKQLGFEIPPSHTNFIFAKPPTGKSAKEIYEYLKSKNILIRYFNGKIVSDYLRITIGTTEENHELLNSLINYLKI